MNTFSLNGLKLFSNLSQETVSIISKFSTTRNFEPGEIIFRQNDKATTFVIIVEGEVNILDENIQIGILRNGDIMGESSLIGGVRLATAQAKSHVKIIEISASSVEQNLSSSEFSKLKNSLFESEIDKLTKLNHIAALSIKQNYADVQVKADLSRFIIYVLTLIFVYMFTIQTVAALQLNLISSSVISIPILIIMGLSMLFMMKKSNYPMSTYGFTLKKSLGSTLLRSSLYTIPVLFVLLIIKWGAINYHSGFSSLTLFHISPALNTGAPPVSPFEAVILVLAYSLFVPVQEIIFRGAMQCSLQNSLQGINKTSRAILISNIPFCMIHFHLSLILVLLTYILGCYWGWIMAKEKSLISPIFSHFIVGLFAFFILGLQDILVI